ncbi:M56 family metallopeptidase [Olleya sp. HaHaR_3_96]|uniref:M56 family metallopeptidase n=1 Tax=Olleya sp. HaHaR_3_96 TaxID=2745560 RepID=UPI001C4E9107|nr:M56 family metallopeptidase [Olleya sp. HaHaR_3_96]QXP60294.1 energy transducer TonB [Olleya sp. HaHaR_3_96]
MLYYVFQTILFQLMFLVAYDLFLKKDTFFNYNRVYLLVTSVLSLVIPLVKVEGFNKVIPTSYLISLPEVFVRNTGQLASQTDSFNSYWSASVVTITSIYVLVSVVMLILFLIKLIKIIRIIAVNPKTKEDGITIVRLKDSDSAFTFLNYVCLGDMLSIDQIQHVLAHERSHANDKHTLDLLWFEVLKISFWCNPLVYLYQNRISNLHEYIADHNAVKVGKADYYQQLLQQVFSVKDYAFINPFFKQSLIKKRIIMLQKSNSKQTKLAKYLLLVPMVLGMLVYSSCSNGDPISKDSDNNQVTPTVMTIIEDIDVDDASNVELDVPFSKLDQSPMFEACQSITGKSQQKKCFSDQVTRHVATNFNIKLGKDLGLEKGVKRINVMFRIDKQGLVYDVKARAPHPDLETEAIRVINTLPKITPAMHEGKTVNVTYALPIVFKIN